MSDFMKMAENYKKIWERSLAERTQEIELLKAENAQLRDALEKIKNGNNMHLVCKIASYAIEELKDKKL